MSTLQPAHRVGRIVHCPHGGIDYTEMSSRGIEVSSIIDLSVCINPYMPPDNIKQLLNTIDIQRYPDSRSEELRDLVAHRFTVASASVLVGSGTTELIRLAALAYLEDGNTAVIARPTYGEYETACQLAGADIVFCDADEADGYRHKPDKILDIISNCHPKVVFFCNPNNPTGVYYDRDTIETISCELDGGLLVLDEAYISFVDKSWSSTEIIETGDVIILRSMTKDYGLTSLRIGYALANQKIIETLGKVCPPWNVNVAAQRAAAQLMHDKVDIDQDIVKLKESRDYLMKGLVQIGYEVKTSQTQFFLVRVGDAQKFCKVLLEHGILVRDCSSFGLPEYVRISPGTTQQCRIFMETLVNIKKEGII